MSKIGFVTDTNLLKKSDTELRSGKGILDTTDFFIEYVDAANKMKSKDELLYFMPELVIEELFSQKKVAFNEHYATFENNFLEMKNALDGELPKNNVNRMIKEEKKIYLPKYKNIKLKYNKKLFEEIVSDAIQKKPPFDKSKEGKKSDAGFKDALIWKTILLSDEISSCNLFYFLSGDKIFEENKVELAKEFNKWHPSTELKIVYCNPDSNQRQSALCTIIEDNNLIKTEAVKLYNRENLLTAIHSITYNYPKEVLYSGVESNIKLINVNFNEFTTEDFIVEDVNELDKKYETVVSFKTTKFMLDEEVDQVKKSLLGKIKIYFKNNEDNMEFDSYEIESIKFDGDYLNNLFSTLYDNDLMTSIEKLKNPFEINSETMKVINSLKSYYKTVQFYDASSVLKDFFKNFNDAYYLKGYNQALSAFNEINKVANVIQSLRYLGFESIVGEDGKEHGSEEKKEE